MCRFLLDEVSIIGCLFLHHTLADSIGNNHYRIFFFVCTLYHYRVIWIGFDTNFTLALEHSASSFYFILLSPRFSVLHVPKGHCCTMSSVSLQQGKLQMHVYPFACAVVDP